MGWLRQSMGQEHPLWVELCPLHAGRAPTSWTPSLWGGGRRCSDVSPGPGTGQSCTSQHRGWGLVCGKTGLGATAEGWTCPAITLVTHDLQPSANASELSSLACKVLQALALPDSWGGGRTHKLKNVAGFGTCDAWAWAVQSSIEGRGPGARQPESASWRADPARYLPSLCLSFLLLKWDSQ